jgi:hypothetical protein
VWAAYSLLALLGIVNPIRMLPLVLLEIYLQAQLASLAADTSYARATVAGE